MPISSAVLGGGIWAGWRLSGRAGKRMAIDTLKLARKLREAGFNETQAEAVADAVREGAEGADLVTKSDLALTTAELRAEIAALRADMREMEQRLILRITNEIAGVRNEIAALKTELLTR